VTLVWDEPKRLQNLAKQGLDFADLRYDFFEASRVFPARRGRFMAIGTFQNMVIVAVVFSPLGSEALSIISLRFASAKERSW